MFDIASSELIVLGAVALLVIPPKDLPKAMRFAGHWVGKVRGVAAQFRSGFDTMVREAELAEMEKKWAAENERIMREHPVSPQMLPLASEPAGLLSASDGAAPADDDGDAPASDADDAPMMTPRPAVSAASGAPHGPPA